MRGRAHGSAWVSGPQGEPDKIETDEQGNQRTRAEAATEHVIGLAIDDNLKSIQFITQRRHDKPSDPVIDRPIQLVYETTANDGETSK